MSLVTQLRSERAQLNTQLQALAQKEAGGDTLSAEELQQFTSLESQMADLTAKIARAESAERLAASAAVPVTESGRGIASPPGQTPHITVTSNEAPGAQAAQIVRLLGAAGGSQLQAAELARAGGFDNEVVMALSTVTPGAGGVLVPTNMAASVIEALRPQAVMRRMGARSLPLLNGNMSLPRVKDSTTISYIGTETDIPVTGMTFADMKLVAKKQAALVPIANDLLKFSGVNPQVDALVAQDLLVTKALFDDVTFIRNVGSDLEPKGLRYQALPFNVVAAPVNPDLQAIDMFLGGLMLRLEAANANMANCGWLMAPRTVRWLQSLRDGNGNKAYPEIEQGQLKGYPIGISTQIPVNLGAGGDESEIYFNDFSDNYIGETGQMTIAYSNEATYKNAGGDVISAFQRDQTLIRLIDHNDFGLRHVESVAVGTAVKWGAGM